MESISLSPYLIAAIFFLIAFIYSSVGLGGGTAYTAIMAILGFNILLIPMISLILNLFVTAIGSFNFIRHRHARTELIMPFLVSSMPMAYIGGSLQLPRYVFLWVMLASLLIVAARIYLWRDAVFHFAFSKSQKSIVSIIAGGLLGLIAGIVGIGGGIYLVPLVIILGLGTTREAAACGAIFIFLNSLAGLVARLQYNPVNISDYIPMIIAVLLGGGLGSLMGSTRFSPRVMQKILGVVILVAIYFLSRKILSL